MSLVSIPCCLEVFDDSPEEGPNDFIAGIWAGLVACHARVNSCWLQLHHAHQFVRWCCMKWVVLATAATEEQICCLDMMPAWLSSHDACRLARALFECMLTCTIARWPTRPMPLRKARLDFLALVDGPAALYTISAGSKRYLAALIGSSSLVCPPAVRLLCQIHSRHTRLSIKCQVRKQSLHLHLWDAACTSRDKQQQG